MTARQPTARVERTLARLDCGEIRDDVDAALKAAEILAFIMATQLQWLLNPDAIDLDERYASHARAVIPDLATTAPVPALTATSRSAGGD